ncbi:MAG: DUF3551 domain-containing protein [Bradyrhizobium sp.]|nr:DUF3551 domain-containing protein [Bradyrhizobium sp.]
MRTLFLALAASATIFATGVTPVVANEYRYCLHGDDYGFEGDCGFITYQQCQASASGRTAYCEVKPYLVSAAVPIVPRKLHRH